MNINNYCLRLMTDRQFLKQEYRKYINNCYGIENAEGTLCYDILHSLLLTAKRKRKIRDMLRDILWYVDDRSISDTNFRMILKFPSKYRNAYAAVLGHHNLAFYQMQILSRFSNSYECFAWMFDRLCHYDCFTEKDIYRLLSENRGVTTFGIQQCIDHAQKNYGDSEKLQVAKQWAKQEGDGFKT